MSELELKKRTILGELRNLCAHCSTQRQHSCPIQRIALQVKAIRGVPLIVNNEFRGAVWSHV